MKQLTLLLCLALCLSLSSCGSDNATDKDGADTSQPTADSHDGDDGASEYDEIPEHASEHMEEEMDFDAFYHQFSANAGDDQFIRGSIDFPYFYASIENYEVSGADFESDENDRYVFQTMTERDDAKISHWDDGYMNGWLNEKFTGKYGDLADIYVVDFEPMPTGYLAYFKFIDGEFKFIGCELIEIGD